MIKYLGGVEKSEGPIQCHEAFIQSVRESSEAKVEIVHVIFYHYGENTRGCTPFWIANQITEMQEEDTNMEVRTTVCIANPRRIFYASPEGIVMQDNQSEAPASITSNSARLLPLNTKNSKDTELSTTQKRTGR